MAGEIDRLLFPPNEFVVNFPFEDDAHKMQLLSGLFDAEPTFAASTKYRITNFCGIYKTLKNQSLRKVESGKDTLVSLAMNNLSKCRTNDFQKAD